MKKHCFSEDSPFAEDQILHCMSPCFEIWTNEWKTVNATVRSVPAHLKSLFFRPQGCLAPVKVIIPPGSVLDPTETAAVVGGNVLTSQRVVDVVLKAFEVCAASQVSVL